MDLLNLLTSQRPMSGETIAGVLGISRAAVHKKIIKLRKQGYEIVGHRNIGYSLVSRPDRLYPEEISVFLPSEPVIGRRILYFEKTDSTQTRGKALAADGAAEGTVLVAERQGSAYGRMRREWSSPEGGLWFSLILRPAIAPDEVSHITFIVSLALCRALEELYGLQAGIKWPNDVLVNGKKAAGILTEMSAEVGRVNWVVTGIGLNANNRIPGGLADKAVSLSQALGKDVNRPELIARFLSTFSILYGTFCAGGFAQFEKEYNGRSCILGRPITATLADRTLEGVAEKIDADGCLVLRTGDGRTTKILAGDIAIEKD